MKQNKCYIVTVSLFYRCTVCGTGPSYTQASRKYISFNN